MCASSYRCTTLAAGTSEPSGGCRWLLQGTIPLRCGTRSRYHWLHCSSVSGAAEGRRRQLLRSALWNYSGAVPCCLPVAPSCVCAQLHQAAAAGFQRSVQWLLQHSATPNQAGSACSVKVAAEGVRWPGSKGNHGNTALHYACLSGNVEVLCRALMKCAAVCCR